MSKPFFGFLKKYSGIIFILIILIFIGYLFYGFSEHGSYFSEFTFKQNQNNEKDYLTTILAFEENFEDIRHQTVLDLLSSELTDEQVSSELTDKQLELWLEEFGDYGITPTKGVDMVQFISNNSFVAGLNYRDEQRLVSGTIVVKYSKDNHFEIIEQLKIFPSSFSYKEWLDLIDKHGKSDLNSVSFIHPSLASFMGVESTSPSWVRVDFNPFMSGLAEDQPDDNNVYFGFYEQNPALFVTNQYLRDNYDLSENQGIIKMIDSPNSQDEPKISFKQLANQRFIFGFPEQTIVDLTSFRKGEDFFNITVRMTNSGEKEEGLVDRTFRVNIDNFYSEALGIYWVYDSDGTVKQFEKPNN